MAVLDFTVANITLPSIEPEFGVSPLVAVADVVRGVSGDRAALLAAAIVARTATIVSWMMPAARLPGVGSFQISGSWP
jgi:hypothetical protein